MKLASLADGRDGRLVVVSADLRRAVDAGPIAPTLQAALDRWAEVAPRLQELSDRLASGTEAGFAFDAAACASPLPRAFQWADGSAYVNHVELVRRARGAELPASFWTDPLMYQGGSDAFLGPHDPITLPDPEWGVDFEGEIAVIIDDVPLGASRTEALKAIRLVMLCNDVSLRNLIPGELAKGFGFFQSKPASAFSPVAVTPEALGPAWQDGRLHLPLHSWLNGVAFGKPDAGLDMTFDFGTLIAHAARSRRLSAGTIIGSGTVSNRGEDGGPGRRVDEGGVGYSCIAELRMIETIQTGKPATPFMQPGDTVRIEMFDGEGRSIFGAIDQRFLPADPPETAA
ncbi:fumarylacetoacetate hydrolase family protein [Chelatococcus asaccharovorans]|uniref:Fumarylacetoacetate (FAA) hydrolase n=1 Tax=Chelatococcus asaccharovorans TaxID=28210 RepID=A0A2V3UJM9_9HYPH|nr:fumarylacetoacetate hydrolase family protein [Chelatococcus asaccharovorans]MBS7706378.1 fumarylacetoacetate hydrolase family protein [Chelatococcus asaccharovorans]PXW64980.1 fumarylacetoacetate (FAA) hydrolase [Chelatococcus asaccharovorans]